MKLITTLLASSLLVSIAAPVFADGDAHEGTTPAAEHKDTKKQKHHNKKAHKDTTKKEAGKKEEGKKEESKKEAAPAADAGHEAGH